MCATLRETLPRAFPDTTFSFLPADIVSQILNFGAPAPIDLQIRGRDLESNFEYANHLLREIRRMPGVADVRIQQSRASPPSRWMWTAPARRSSG
jgi:multidrug efflux pump subunit AcrB